MIGFIVGMFFVCTVMYFWISFLLRRFEMKIEGIPDGWELVRIGKPFINERYIGLTGQIINCVAIPSGEGYAIVRKIEKPKKKKQYRPFANATEFEPFRDRWIRRGNKHDTPDRMPAGCFKVTAYCDHHYWTGDGISISYKQTFDDGQCFDDGTPFGIEVKE